MEVPSEAMAKSFLEENPSFVRDWILNVADHQMVEQIAQAIKVDNKEENLII
jgi:hypothetical protein